MSKKVNKFSRSTKLLAGAILGGFMLTELFGFGTRECFHRAPEYREQEISTRSESSYYDEGLDGKIYLISEKEYDSELVRDAEKGILKEIERVNQSLEKKIVDLKFKEVNGKDFVQCVERTVNVDYFTPIFDNIKKDFENIGVNHSYEIRTLISISQLKERDYPLIYLVDSLGSEATLQADAVHDDGSIRPINFDLNFVASGVNFSDTSLINGEIVESKGDIFVNANDIRINLCSGLYTEPLHREISDVGFITNLINFKGYSEQTNFNRAKKLAMITEEAIVHGLFYSWVEENLSILGISRDDLEREIAEKNQFFRYKGAEIIKRIANRDGRKFVVDDYITNPTKYWDLLSKEVPEFRDF